MNTATEQTEPETTRPGNGGPDGKGQPEAAVVWRNEDLRDPHADAGKAGKVRSMFAAIAGSYDLNNRVHSLGLDQSWRRHAVRTAAVKAGETVLDVACGTGDLTEAFARRTGAERVIGVDFTAEMLDIARGKRLRRQAGLARRIEYRQGDAQALEIDDASVDVVSIAFGIRNVQQPERALAEFARVLRPGGRLLILEFDTPRFPPVRWANAFYSGWVMPRTATLLSGDRSGAYRYLPKSVESFLTRAELVGMIGAAGFTDVRVRSLTMGICACYRAVRAGG